MNSAKKNMYLGCHTPRISMWESEFSNVHLILQWWLQLKYTDGISWKSGVFSWILIHLPRLHGFYCSSTSSESLKATIGHMNFFSPKLYNMCFSKLWSIFIANYKLLSSSLEARNMLRRYPATINGTGGTNYCRWLKSCTNWYAAYPIIYQV